MNEIRKIIKIPLYCLARAIRHPFRLITCQTGNPIRQDVSPVPWWGSVGVLVIGIASWCASAKFNIEGLDEAARAMVYIPLGNIFGMTIGLSSRQNEK